MRKILPLLVAAALLSGNRADACTNVIVTPGASADGSSMVSYAADSHTLYGELYFTPAGTFGPGSMLSIREWDTQRPLGSPIIFSVSRYWVSNPPTPEPT